MAKWPEYEAGLRRRGSLALWLTPDALCGWQVPGRKTRGGQHRYSDLAIKTALTLYLLFGLRLSPSRDLFCTAIDGAGIRCARSYHLSRRAQTWRSAGKRPENQVPPAGPLHVLVDSTGFQVYGAGQWLEEKHGARSRRGWRKLHLALHADSGEIIAHTMTDQHTGDVCQVEPLLDQIGPGPIGRFTADGAYNRPPAYAAVIDHSAGGDCRHSASR
ncbi:IS5 family transposase [Mesorhizobium sp. M1050]|uniref:IS5 family transposase n=1 Tax=Mesorhizobium sp. M1050 TaxID=2957051 RepID=UPI00333C9857